MGLVPWKNKQKDTRPGEPTEPSALGSLRSEMEKLLESFPSLEWPFGSERAWSPPVDVGETDDEVIVRAEVPGIDPADLEVSVSKGQLVLAGEKRERLERSEQGFYHSESRYGRFRRTVPISEAADPEQVEADCVDGVLTIRLKKSPSAPPRRVEVKVKEEPPGPERSEGNEADRPTVPPKG